MLTELNNKKNKNLIIYILLGAIFLISLYLFEVIIPFAVAFIIAYLVNPIKKFFDQYLNETVSSLLSIIIFILCFLSIFDETTTLAPLFNASEINLFPSFFSPSIAKNKLFFLTFLESATKLLNLKTFLFLVILFNIFKLNK